jgi:hypothetical protein
MAKKVFSEADAANSGTAQQSKLRIPCSVLKQESTPKAGSTLKLPMALCNSSLVLVGGRRGVLVEYC